MESREVTAAVSHELSPVPLKLTALANVDASLVTFEMSQPFKSTSNRVAPLNVWVRSVREGVFHRHIPVPEKWTALEKAARMLVTLPTSQAPMSTFIILAPLNISLSVTTCQKGDKKREGE